jgi:tRNA-Thr(GGU) m(6)t(6)A37 methyltransferase TsaA
LTEPTPPPAPDRRKVVDEIHNLLAELGDLSPGAGPTDTRQRQAESVAVPSSPQRGLEFTPIGVVESTLQSLADAPRQGSEGAPDAWVVVHAQYAAGLLGLTPGDALVLLTWLDRADRTTLQVHPRDDRQNPLTGVFRTRSADRPNPIGVHQVTLREIQGNRLRVGPLEAVHGTPVLDLKPVL